jgi:hypothetical protein
MRNPFSGLSLRRLMALPDIPPLMRPFARVVVLLIYPALITWAVAMLLVDLVALVVLWPVKWSLRRTSLPPKPPRRVP